MAKKPSTTPIALPAPATPAPTGAAARHVINALVAVLPTSPPARSKPTVVYLREKETTESIVRDVQERSRRQSQEITDRLRSLTEMLEEQHREEAKKLLPIGYAMDRPTLDDFIEIGRRMAGLQQLKRGGRRNV